MIDFEIWHRCTTAQPIRKDGSSRRLLFVPPIEPVGALPYELSGLLPNREHRRDLMELIDHLPANPDCRRSIVGIFAADPFLDCERIAKRLIRKGYHQVVNIPPVTGYGAEFLAILDKVALGRAQEQRNLGRLAKGGLTLSLALTAIDHLDVALSWSPPRVWVVPGFDIWRCDSDDAARLMLLCREISERTDVPIILAAGGTGILPQDAASCGAGGILLDEDRGLK